MQKDINYYLNFLDNLDINNIELGLNRISQVFNYIQNALNFQKISPKVITVAGTNGKGSTCKTIEEIALVNNLTTLVYSSPHLISFNERFRLNGEDIDNESLCQAFALIFNYQKDIKLTYFEYSTLLAFLLAYLKKVDLTILEVGLGGRLDATNIINNDLSIITNIDLEHIALLGDTREKIGFEKAGIIKENSLCICGCIDENNQINTPKSILEVAAQKNTKILQLNKDFYLQDNDFIGSQIIHNLPKANLYINNVLCGLQAYLAINLPFNEINLASAFAKLSLPGRFEKITIKFQNKQKLIILDVAHNANASKLLVKNLQEHKLKEIVAVFSMLNDKNLDEVLNDLKTSIKHYYIAELPTPRATKLQEIENIMHNYQCSFSSFTDIETAFLEAIKTNDTILVFGSFYVISAIKQFMQQEML